MYIQIAIPKMTPIRNIPFEYPENRYPIEYPIDIPSEYPIKIGGTWPTSPVEHLKPLTVRGQAVQKGVEHR